MLSSSAVAESLKGRARFATTRWTMVFTAGDQAGPECREALASLCRSYWYPLYAHIRRRCRDGNQALDLTQEFFADVLDRGVLQVADPNRGRFRSFLLAAADHFLSNQRDREQAAKRGGGARIISLDVRDAEDRLLREPADSFSPEEAFERRWALTLLETVKSRLRGEHSSPDKAGLFEQLEPYLARGEGPGTYREPAERLRMSEGAVKVAIHRLRQRFGTLLREEIGQTVARPEDIDDEIRSLFAALSR